MDRKPKGAVESAEPEDSQAREAERTGDGIKVKLDQQTANALIKVAMRQKHTPGKYDVFAWEEDRKLRSLAVAWKTYTRRSIELENVGNERGEEIATNAAPLPNGMVRNSALYVGSFRIDGTQQPEEG